MTVPGLYFLSIPDPPGEPLAFQGSYDWCLVKMRLFCGPDWPFYTLRHFGTGHLVHHSNGPDYDDPRYIEDNPINLRFHQGIDWVTLFPDETEPQHQLTSHRKATP